MREHDWDGSWYCFECSVWAGSPEAKLECRPTTEELMRDAPAEIDYAAITRGLAG